MLFRSYGGKKEDEVSATVHTAMIVSVAGGVFLTALGFAAAKPLLELMDTPENVIGLSVLYMRIYFAGMPVMLLYNFGSAVLRAIGDTRRPLFYLIIAGVINVCLNLCFVVGFHMVDDGVALATVISQCVSAGLIVRCLMRSEGCFQFSFSRLKMDWEKFGRIARIGLPAGVQGALFSVSNVLIQSSVNSFGSVAMAGNTAAQNIEGFVYTSMNAVYQTALSFTSQNFGAKQFDRMRRILVYCLMLTTMVGFVMGGGAVVLARQLLGIYSSDGEVIRYGMNRLRIIGTTYCVCGLMDSMVGCLRGMGYSVMPMIVSLTGACGLRVLWIYTVFAMNRTLQTLYISYPVSWGITFAAHLVCYLVVIKKVKRQMGVLA